MKRKIIASVLLFALVLTVFVGCTKGKAADDKKEPQDEPTLSGYVIENTSGNILVSSEDGLTFVSTEGAKIMNGQKEISASELKPGMNVKITYDGAVLESYPGQIPNTRTIKVMSQENDKVSLYKKAVIHTYEEREKLGEEKTIALDFSEITSLDEDQKNALEYVLGNYFATKTDANVIRGSYKELEKNGVIKNNAFNDGIILSVSEKGENKFSVGWWKSGTCASGFSDCTAKIKSGEWVINYGDAWIS